MGSITVSNLGKAYKQYPHRWSRLLEWIVPGGKPRHKLKWVLQDVSFTVQPGEAVGVVGVNGAGKSTLLKMITGTVQPTTGSVQVNGRVAALLELGMGFHPDFTGRQNALMASQLAGLSLNEAMELMPAIEQFADIGEYFDQPVRVYSSGMQARVAFAAATASLPDILIVDEALSVGDIAFQAKCLLRMNELQEAGVSILFVSHGLNQVRQFCQRALYLANGTVRGWGASDEVCDLYQNDLSGAAALEKKEHDSSNCDMPPSYTFERDWNLRKNSAGGAVGGTLELEFTSFKILDSSGRQVTSCRQDEKVTFRAVIHANREIEAGANVGLLFADKNGYQIAACNTNFYDKYLPAMREGDAAVIEWKMSIPFALGEFRIDIGIKREPFAVELIDRVFCAGILNVVPDVLLLKRNFGGYLFIRSDVDLLLVPRGVMGAKS